MSLFLTLFQQKTYQTKRVKITCFTGNQLIVPNSPTGRNLARAHKKGGIFLFEVWILQVTA